MSESKKLPSEIQFASFFAYNPRSLPGGGRASTDSQRLVRSIKTETRQCSERWRIAEYVAANCGAEIRQHFLHPDTTLVPVPGHAPRKEAGAHWPARVLCDEFVKYGLGGQWLELLLRREKVNKAATSKPDDRPTADRHAESLDSIQDLTAGKRMTVVDDVITKGATMLASVAVLQAAYPGAQVQGFALIRTQSNEVIQAVVDPVRGVVRLGGRQTIRRP